MTANPNPARITDAMWWYWEQCLANIPGAKLGGIYADKSCYHNTVSANLSRWPGTYCVQLPLDLDFGPRDKARAIDLTLSDSEMKKRTGYLKRAADHPEDNRLYGLRSFIGTLDGTNVFCYIRNTDSGPWTFDGGRDSSHLWHIHESWWTKYCADLEAAKQIASVTNGVTWEEWNQQEGEDMAFRVRITSSDPEWNGKLIIGSAGVRFTVRNPGEIRNALAKLYPTQLEYNDATRGSLTWDSFLDGVFGEDISQRTTNVDARFQDISDQIAAIESGTASVNHNHPISLSGETGHAEPVNPR